MDVEKIIKKDINLIIKNINNISLSEKHINMLLMKILSNQSSNKDLNLEEDFLLFYKLSEKNNTFLNYSFFHNFIDLNWINAVKYSLENVNLNLITEESEKEIICVRRCVDLNKPQILDLILKNKKEILKFYSNSSFVTDHLGFAYLGKNYEVCAVLAQYKCFINTFQFFYDGTSNEFDKDIKKILYLKDRINNLNNF